MWLFTKVGFFSVVETRPRTREELDQLDQGCFQPQMMIRARLRRDAEALNTFLTSRRFRLVSLVWTETKGTDYRFRAVTTRKRWKTILCCLTEALDYSNFKNATHEHTARDTAYMKCWMAMDQLQQSEHPRPREPRRRLKSYTLAEYNWHKQQSHENNNDSNFTESP